MSYEKICYEKETLCSTYYSLTDPETEVKGTIRVSGEEEGADSYFPPYFVEASTAEEDILIVEPDEFDLEEDGPVLLIKAPGAVKKKTNASWLAIGEKISLLDEERVVISASEENEEVLDIFYDNEEVSTRLAHFFKGNANLIEEAKKIGIDIKRKDDTNDDAVPGQESSARSSRSKCRRACRRRYRTTMRDCRRGRRDCLRSCRRMSSGRPKRICKRRCRAIYHNCRYWALVNLNNCLKYC